MEENEGRTIKEQRQRWKTREKGKGARWKRRQ